MHFGWWRLTRVVFHQSWCKRRTYQRSIRLLHHGGLQRYLEPDVTRPVLFYFLSDPSKQETHNGCVPATNDGMEGKGWCATTTTSDGIFDTWGYCEDPKCSNGPAAAPASNTTLGQNPFVICGSCIAFGIVPSAVKCATNGTDVGETFLKAFDVSCIFKKCICNLLISTKARTFINILSMVGICARPLSWDWSNYVPHMIFVQ